jgi:CRISPR-associated exonuclease Cas4
MYDENDLLPLSGLQHLAFCPRQWALIELEGQWSENRLTAEGRLLHERADEAEVEVRGGVRIVRGLRIHSLRLGLSGVADVVEFHRLERDEPAGVRLPTAPGLWRPLPVEYKRGRPKRDPCDAVQLCAQALCIEEMLGADIPQGYLFYGQKKRRFEVDFDEALRSETADLAAGMHRLYSEGRTPPARHGPHCERCSLKDKCLPETAARGKSARDYLGRAIASALEEDL